MQELQDFWVSELMDFFINLLVSESMAKVIKRHLPSYTSRPNQQDLTFTYFNQ